mmetsp:Transcript_14644/g.34240  ORF Transcript_14644/g.34240 Transcript_14644/m.34240 type:complete len:473 (+) Transcript_14644:592-2010(+)
MLRQSRTLGILATAKPSAHHRSWHRTTHTPSSASASTSTSAYVGGGSATATGSSSSSAAAAGAAAPLLSLSLSVPSASSPVGSSGVGVSLSWMGEAAVADPWVGEEGAGEAEGAGVGDGVEVIFGSGTPQPRRSSRNSAGMAPAPTAACRMEVCARVTAARQRSPRSSIGRVVGPLGDVPSTRSTRRVSPPASPTASAPGCDSHKVVSAYKAASPSWTPRCTRATSAAAAPASAASAIAGPPSGPWHSRPKQTEARAACELSPPASVAAGCSSGTRSAARCSCLPTVALAGSTSSAARRSTLLRWSVGSRAVTSCTSTGKAPAVLIMSMTPPKATQWPSVVTTAECNGPTSPLPADTATSCSVMIRSAGEAASAAPCASSSFVSSAAAMATDVPSPVSVGAATQAASSVGKVFEARTTGRSSASHAMCANVMATASRVRWFAFLESTRSPSRAEHTRVASHPPGAALPLRRS